MCVNDESNATFTQRQRVDDWRAAIDFVARKVCNPCMSEYVTKWRETERERARARVRMVYVVYGGRPMRTMPSTEFISATAKRLLLKRQQRQHLMTEKPRSDNRCGSEAAVHGNVLLRVFNNDASGTYADESVYMKTEKKNKTKLMAREMGTNKRRIHSSWDAECLHVCVIEREREMPRLHVGAAKTHSYILITSYNQSMRHISTFIVHRSFSRP